MLDISEIVKQNHRITFDMIHDFHRQIIDKLLKERSHHINIGKLICCNSAATPSIS